MRVIHGQDRRGPVFSALVVVGAVGLLGLTIFSKYSLRSVAPLLALAVLFAVTQRVLLRWRSLIVLVVFVILFIPMKRYSLPASLPINLEPYRLLVFVIAVGWLTSLLVDPRVRFRRTPIDRPLLWFAAIVLLSDAVNRSRVASVQPLVIKKLLFFLSFFVVFYLIASVVRRFADVEFVTRALVGGAAVVAVFALVERNTGYDVFNHLQSVLPFLHLNSHNVPSIPSRGGRLRVYASAQHPIALGAALAMLVPFAVYLAKRSGRYWWIAAGLLVLGSLATGSRTGVVVLLVIVLSYLLLGRITVGQLWPALIPALLVIHFATPGSLGTLRSAFFPKGGIVAQQTNDAVGSGRLATLWPALHTEFSPDPIVGEGFGTRITTAEPPDVPQPNAPILDDQWLGILLETGLVGALTLAWLFVRLIRQLLPEVKRDDSPRSWFLVAVIASVSGFAASMLFYDAFSFIQVTFLLFIVMGLGVSAFLAPELARVPGRVRARAPRPALTRYVDRPHGQPG
ncbi:MAG TPA: O-antigen ligase family protein [Gaiellaceae bacterium]